jgi:hypothetical protein
VALYECCIAAGSTRIEFVVEHPYLIGAHNNGADATVEPHLDNQANCESYPCP